MDTSAAIKTTVWEILAQDEDLKQICGGKVNIHNVWAKPDSVFPYFTYRLRIEEARPWIIERAVMTIDGWDYAQTEFRLSEMRRRLIELLDKQYFHLPEAGAVRVEKVWVEDMPEDTEHIWRFTSRWSFRFIRTTEYKAILERGL